jgi:hypothetical protein
MTSDYYGGVDKWFPTPELRIANLSYQKESWKKLISLTFTKYHQLFIKIRLVSSS